MSLSDFSLKARVAVITIWAIPLFLFVQWACPGIFVPSARSWTPEVHTPDFQVDFSRLGRSWGTADLRIIYGKGSDGPWVFCGGRTFIVQDHQSLNGVWLDLATKHSSLAEWKDGIWAGPGQKIDPSFHRDLGHLRIYPNGPQFHETEAGRWVYGERPLQNYDSQTTRWALGPGVDVLFAGRWKQREGWGLTGFISADGPFKPYKAKFETFTGDLSLVVRGVERWRQHVREWNTDDFSQTFQVITPESRLSKSTDKLASGDYVVVLYYHRDYRPEMAWGFRVPAG